MVLVCKRLLKEGKATIDGLRAYVTRADNAGQLEDVTAEQAGDAQEASSMESFDAAYRQWYALQLEANRWANGSSRRRPLRAYERHAEPHIGNMRLDKVRRPLIKRFMQPLFISNPEIASKLLGFLNEVCEGALDAELIDHNPCPRLKSFALPKRETHHAPTLHYSELQALWDWLRTAPFSAPVKLAMKLSVVTAHRASVVAFAQWEHIDLSSGVWTVPKRNVEVSEVGLMKSGREFACKLPEPLCDDLIALYKSRSNKRYAFSVDGTKSINPETLRRNFMKFGPITSHGFRSTFKVWCLNQTPPIDPFLADRYLDHSLVGLDRNYRRDSMFEQRAALMQRYYDYVIGGNDG
jgi:integrase